MTNALVSFGTLLATLTEANVTNKATHQGIFMSRILDLPGIILKQPQAATSRFIDTFTPLAEINTLEADPDFLATVAALYGEPEAITKLQASILNAAVTQGRMCFLFSASQLERIRKKDPNLLGMESIKKKSDGRIVAAMEKGFFRYLVRSTSGSPGKQGTTGVIQLNPGYRDFILSHLPPEERQAEVQRQLDECLAYVSKSESRLEPVFVEAAAEEPEQALESTWDDLEDVDIIQYRNSPKPRITPSDDDPCPEAHL